MNGNIERSTFTDARDGAQYKTVKIGSQVWMAENLKYNANGSVCYNYDEANGEKYGRLYDWRTAMAACPKGWHLPTDSEWQTLIDYAGGEKTAGAKLKSASGWKDYEDENEDEGEDNGTDEYGFGALPGGYCLGGDFITVGCYGYWWSATEDGPSDAWGRDVSYGRENVDRGIGGKAFLFSVRCVRD